MNDTVRMRPAVRLNPTLAAGFLVAARELYAATIAAVLAEADPAQKAVLGKRAHNLGHRIERLKAELAVARLQARHA